jgi:hypothetical protein
MFPCLLGRLAATPGFAFRAAGFAGLMHLLEERSDGRVGLAGDVFGDLNRLALGGGGGFAHGRVFIGLGHRLANAALFVRRKSGNHAAAVGWLLAITFALARGFAGGLGLRLTFAFFASASRLGVGLAVAAFGAARSLAAGLGLGLASRLIGLTLFHGLADLFKNRGDGRIRFAGGVIGKLAGFLLGLGGGLLGLSGLLVRFLYGRVPIGFLHGFAEALLFVRGERDREARVGAAFGGRSVGANVRARGFFGRKTEGGEEEQG